MKVLFYSHTGKISGAENIMLMTLRLLNKSRFSPIVVCPDADNMAETVREMGFECETVEQLEARFTWRIDLLVRYLFSFLRTMKQLRGEIKEANPSLIHANSIRAGLVATTASVGTKTPVIWVLQDALPVHPISTMIRIFVLFSKRTRLLPVSQATLESFRGKLLKIFGKNIPAKVVHNAIELEKFEIDESNRKQIRNELKLTDDEFVLGIIGQITPRKGQFELIKTFANVQKKIPDSTLLIVGAPMFNNDHVYFEKLKDTVRDFGIEKKVKFLGLRKDVPAIMQSLDLLVINSKSEALVIVAIEAMASRTPIVATHVGGTTEIIEHEKNGLIVPFGDERKLTEAILRMANNAELCEKFAVESEKIAHSHLSATRMMREVEEFYEQCAPEEKKAPNSNLAIES